MNYILTAQHIHKKYGGEEVLSDATIHVKKGAIYGLVGKNGSGKTTLLRILTGQITEYTGTVCIDELSKEKPKISTVINDPGLFLNLTAFENMKVQAHLFGINDRSKIDEVLKIVGLGDCNRKLVKKFSLGMLQRLKLAVALLMNPDILILDEPLNGLDPNGIVELRQLLLRLNHTIDMTILVSSHILKELEQIATCFGVLYEGKIVREVSAEEIFEKGNTLEELYMHYTKGEQSSCHMY